VQPGEGPVPLTACRVICFNKTVKVHGATIRDTRYAPFTARAIEVMRAIPRGKVATYAQVAAVAGSPLAARQVVRVLHSLSRAERLPWQRVINSRGSISLPRGAGFEEQKALLEVEGVAVKEDGRIDMNKYLWVPRMSFS
jgi:methylated-DNA-protein-cysteine methyltransferase related protein